MSADWCQGLKPTNQISWYFLITTRQQLNKAREWLDSNLKDMFLEHIPRYNTFEPIKGYPYLQRANKPQFHMQLGTYANLLWMQYTVNPNKPPDQMEQIPSPKDPIPNPKDFDIQQQRIPRTYKLQTKTNPEQNP